MLRRSDPVDNAESVPLLPFVRTVLFKSQQCADGLAR
jgi:hypothetical protein